MAASTTPTVSHVLFLSAQGLGPCASSTTTASALSYTSNEGVTTATPPPTTITSPDAPTTAARPRLSSTASAAGTTESEHDRRLHNMPKALATACVQAFVDWGHDHKADPAAYQAFLQAQLPRFSGVAGEKVRLYMKNIAAAYHERYVPARARE